jgi:hypothetical protein
VCGIAQIGTNNSRTLCVDVAASKMGLYAVVYGALGKIVRAAGTIYRSVEYSRGCPYWGHGATSDVARCYLDPGLGVTTGKPAAFQAAIPPPMCAA